MEVERTLPNEPFNSSIEIQQRIDKDAYVEKVQLMLEHIHKGDLYEANFCMEFFAENAIVNPLEKFNKLNEISQAPFSVAASTSR